MHLFRFGITYCLSIQPLYPDTKRKICSLNTLGKFLSREVFFFRQTIINGIIICTVKPDSKRRQESQQLFQRFPAAIPKHMCHYPFPIRLPGIPEPALIFLITDKGPLFVYFTDKMNLTARKRQRSYLSWREFFNVRMTVLIPTFRTRAVSLTPALFMAISIIRSFIPGWQA